MIALDIRALDRHRVIASAIDGATIAASPGATRPARKDRRDRGMQRILCRATARRRGGRAADPAVIRDARTMTRLRGRFRSGVAIIRLVVRAGRRIDSGNAGVAIAQDGRRQFCGKQAATGARGLEGAPESSERVALEVRGA
jgi:hypothetical protein